MKRPLALTMTGLMLLLTEPMWTDVKAAGEETHHPAQTTPAETTHTPAPQQQAAPSSPSPGGMGGMMSGSQVPNLKKLDPEDRVKAIAHCGDTYTVTMANGQEHKFWERNLRIKTDTSGDGPERNAPALVGAGMMGDRADVIFADPGEISPLVVSKCE